MAGRPRSQGERYPSGDLKPAGPTIELTAHRAALVGGFADPERKGENSSPNDPRAGYPIGVLYLRGALTKLDHDAALEFAALYKSIFGRGSIPSHLANFLPSTPIAELSEAEKVKRAAKLGEAITAVKSLETSRPYDMLLHLAVFEHPLRFMDSARARSPQAWRADQADKDALTQATDALVRLWEMRR